MHLRAITRADLPATAACAAASFHDDELFAFLFPHRDAYPDAYASGILARNRVRFVQPGSWGLACVADAADDPALGAPGSLLGYAFWHRSHAAAQPPPADAYVATPSPYATNNTTLLHAFERALIAVEAAYERRFLPLNPARDPAAAAAFAAHRVAHDPFAAAPAQWHLGMLAVAPAAQRRGVGGRLVAWGLRRARAEGVPACLIASGQGLGLYRKMGFRVVEVLELEGVQRGGAACVWDPWGAWTREEAEEVVIMGVKVECAWREEKTHGVEEAWRREEGWGAGEVLGLC